MAATTGAVPAMSWSTPSVGPSFVELKMSTPTAAVNSRTSASRNGNRAMTGPRSAALVAVSPAAVFPAGRPPQMQAPDRREGPAIRRKGTGPLFSAGLFRQYRARLQIAQQQQRLPNHAEEAELLLGGLDLAYGLRDEADRIFQKPADGRDQVVCRFATAPGSTWQNFPTSAAISMRHCRP